VRNQSQRICVDTKVLEILTNVSQVGGDYIMIENNLSEEKYNNESKGSNSAIVEGSKLVVVKGCRALEVSKYERAEVVRIECLGEDYSHFVKVVVKIGQKTRVLFVRHYNRLSDLVIRMNTGNPNNVICFSKIKS